MFRDLLIFLFLLTMLLPACSQEAVNGKPKQMIDPKDEQPSPKKLATATFGAGCFWCVEAIFEQLVGVEKVVSGYCGGTTGKPSYQDVCTGETGHAEVCRISYDPERISYRDLLQVFWQTHDPTTRNRQGNDIGTQYRSVIFYHDQRQKQIAEACKKELTAAQVWNKPIVTEIVPITTFYSAENYHQDYYRLNRRQPYCQYVIRPKLEKFRKVFSTRLQKKN